MFRRFAATLVAVLVLAVVSATPALAKGKDGGGPGKGSVVTGPAAGGTGTDSGGTSGPGTGAGTGTATQPAEPPKSGSGGSTGSGSGPATPKPGATKPTGKTKDSPRKTEKSEPTRKPAAAPSSETTVQPRDSYSSPAPEVTSASVVRASAAPAVADPGVNALLPAPNPMLLPDNATTVAAPVDAERSSSLPQAVPALLVGAGILSVAVTGTVFARRRASKHSA